jgi:hypothetical protein
MKMTAFWGVVLCSLEDLPTLQQYLLLHQQVDDDDDGGSKNL